MKKSAQYPKLSLLLLVLLVLATQSVLGQGILGIKGENTASLGLYIKDLKTGKVVFESNAKKALIPASITKSLTSATALSLLGSDFRFRTRVTLDNYRLSKGRLTGTLTVHATGDPTLESEFFMDNRGFCDSIARRLAERGVREFAGTITVEDTIPDSGQVESWSIDDTPWDYGAGFYGLNWKDNTFLLYPASGKSKPHVPDLKIIKHRNKSVDLKRGMGSSTLHVYAPRKTLANNKWSVVTTMNNPAESMVHELMEALDKYGIKYTPAKKTKSSRGKDIVLYTHTSPSLDEMLRSLMVRSDNMFAEGMLRAIRPGKSREDALEAEIDLWNKRGFDTEPITLCDGSGLSRNDRFSPEFLGGVLEWMYKSPMAERYISYFPISGKDGTMKNFCKANRLAGRLAFKTGSMNGVQCFAGYVLDSENSKPSHVVVIMANSFYCSRAALREALERFLLSQLP